MAARNIGDAPLRALAALAVLTLTAGCNVEAKDRTAGTETGGAPEPASEDRERLGNTAGADGADDRPKLVATESDRLALEMAQNACRARDFKSLFQAYSISWLVRENYTAKTVRFGAAGKTMAKSRRDYIDEGLFPIGLIDNGWVTADTVRLFDADPDFDWRKSRYVEVEFNTAPDNRQRIDYQAGIFERNLDPPPAELEEGLGAMIEPVGPPGYLLFYPTETCWELVEDAHYPPPQP